MRKVSVPIIALLALCAASPLFAEPQWKEGDPRVAARERHAPEYYRLYEDKVMLLPLSDKGIPGADVKLRASAKSIKRPLPEAAFGSGKVDKPNSAKPFSAPFELKELNGIGRNAKIRTGVPVAKGELFKLPGALVVTDPAGVEVPAQFAATGFWPDGSIKWVLVQFDAPLKANESATYRLQNAPGKKSAAAPGKLICSEDADFVIVDTGKIIAKIDKKNFRLLSGVTDAATGKALGSFNGVTLTDENGRKFSSSRLAPLKITREEEGGLETPVGVLCVDLE